jgi:hypothetical protein
MGSPLGKLPSLSMCEKLSPKDFGIKVFLVDGHWQAALGMDATSKYSCTLPSAEIQSSSDLAPFLQRF